MTFYSRGTSNPRWMARTDLTGSATPSATGSQTRQGLIARLPTGSKSRSGMTVSPLDLRNSAGRSRRNNDSPTPRSPSIPPGNVYKPDRALATQFTISKSNDQPARRALVLGPLDSRSPLEGVRSGVPLFTLSRTKLFQEAPREFVQGHEQWDYRQTHQRVQ